MALQFVPPQYLITDRKKHLVIGDNRAYHVTKKTEIDRYAFGLPVNLGEWRYNLICSHKPRCFATAKVEYNEFTDSYSNFQMQPGKVHSEECPWDEVGICLEYCKSQVYAKLKNGEFQCPLEAYKWGQNMFVTFYPGYVTSFPKASFFNSKSYRIVLSRFPPLPNLEQLVNLQIPNRLTVTLRDGGQPFLLFQHSFLHPACSTYPLGRWDSMIVYSSAERFHNFCDATTILADGTFGTCPHPFYQIHISHVPFENRVRPCVFALLTRKTEFIYTLLFERLRLLAIERQHPMKVTKFRCDFETAQMNAAVATYFAHLTAEELLKVVCGCFFHFCSAIYKMAMALGLSGAYRNLLTYCKMYLKMCMALAFLPVEDIPFTFGQIMHEWNSLPPTVPPRPDLSPFFEYFHNAWIIGNVAPRERWSISDLNSRRTTNDCESYHSQLKRAIGARVSLWHFLEKLQEEEQRIDIDIQRILAGQAYTGKARTEQINDRLKTFKANFLNGEFTPLGYVKAIAHLMPT